MSRRVEHNNNNSAFSQHDSSTQVTALLVPRMNQQKEEYHQGQVKARNNLERKILTVYIA